MVFDICVDAIDGGNNKKAIQEAEKVLKALALIRSDKHTEAWPLIEEVESLKEDIDENTLQAMCHCFKEAYTPERISTLYERVCARFPKNEQYLTHLFMSYVRVRNYKLQQKTALSLFKEFQRNPYYFWNVMSIVMQVCRFSLEK
uniref:N-terminal acetyltransferase B complex subunit NAA25 homolog n=1 Tax=Parascaris equorum TaxID=6256 RepID=A0A914R9H8_PAREQ